MKKFVILTFISLIFVQLCEGARIKEESKLYENKYFHIKIKNPNPDWVISAYPDKKRDMLSVKIGKKGDFYSVGITLTCRKTQFKELGEYLRDIESKANRFKPDSLSKQELNVDFVKGVKIVSSFKYGTSIGVYWLYKGFQYELIANGENLNYLNEALDTIKIIE